jgi:hypothetical protein
MNQDIIKWAQQWGDWNGQTVEFNDVGLERFAALVAEQERQRNVHMADPEQPEQEPVAWMTPGQDLHLNNSEGFRFSDWTPLFTHPPRREWRGLSEEEINEATFHPDGRMNTHLEFARAIEAKLKEKNHD